MRKLLSTLFGLISAGMGLLIVLPRINGFRDVWKAQLVFSEIPFVGTLFGLLAALVRRSSVVGRVLGLLGAALSIYPMWRWYRARRNMDAMMVDGLGLGYGMTIPLSMRPHMMPTRLWPTNISHMTKPEEVTIKPDIPFYKTPQRMLKLDVYRPSAARQETAPFPAIITLHPGGWRHGDKGGVFAPHHRYLATQGYVVFDMQYRLTGFDEARWPDMLEDVRAAIRFVKKQASMFDVDPDRIALFGRSAGGHIALHAAYQAHGEHADTAVQAVIAGYAPTNLFITGPEPEPRTEALLGGTLYDIPDAYHDASPIEHVGHDAPPTLLMHGTRDGLVSAVHAELLYNRLREENVPAVLLRVPWGRHAFDAVRIGLGGQITQYHLDRFLAWSLYGMPVEQEVFS